MAEQFDSETFNRGWNFNGALAVASGLTTASPDIKADMGIDFDCAVIQETWRERGFGQLEILVNIRVGLISPHKVNKVKLPLPLTPNQKKTKFGSMVD